MEHVKQQDDTVGLAVVPHFVVCSKWQARRKINHQQEQAQWAITHGQSHHHVQLRRDPTIGVVKQQTLALLPRPLFFTNANAAVGRHDERKVTPNTNVGGATVSRDSCRMQTTRNKAAPAPCHMQHVATLSGRLLSLHRLHTR